MVHMTNTDNPIDFPTITTTNFRLWVQHIWHENCREYEGYGQQPMPAAVYWRQYKWWLKREYQRINKS
jgi:hypothetical protein